MQITYKHELTKAEMKPESLIEILLKNRGVTDVELFLKPPSPLTFTLKDFGYDTEIGKTMKILEEIKEKGETIVVYTDYDADGITGGSIVWETLHHLGFKVMPYVPHRKLEGYGFSNLGIDNVKRDFNPALIISVDHGITAIKQIEYAKSLGIKVIITDHHHKQEKIPKAAEAIFHIPALSGSGVGYFFAKQVFLHFGKGSKYEKLLKKNFETDYLALASIGTIADLVPLVGPSRSVVTAGLAAFPQVKRLGIRQLIKEAGIEDKVISPYEIGFVIAPRINAVGRLEHAIDALRLLCTTSLERASELAGKVGKKNTERQVVVKENVIEALALLEKMEQDGGIPKIIILHTDHWHEGVIGLIASNILEKYYRPVIVMTQSDGQLKGSARSIPSFHITHFFEELKDYFLNFGGHAGAAGFTLSEEKLEDFKKKAIKVASKQIKDSDLVRIIEVDAKVPVGGLTMSLAKKMDTLKPFGIGNPQPSFVSDVEVIQASLFGKTHDHLKIMVKDPESSSFPIEMIGFGKADIFTTLSKGQKIQVAYQLDINQWNGKETLRGRIMSVLS
jgi:single-stranded-DNA-specific exonuclease